MRFYPQANSFIMIDGDDVSSGPPPPSWNPREYERVVQNALGRVQASRTGDMVLQTTRDLARRPNQPGGVTSQLFIAPDFSPRGAHVRLVSLNLNSPKVLYSPLDYEEGNSFCLNNRWAVLVHELFHGVSGLSGQRSSQPLDNRYGGTAYYPNVEEFYAVLVSNIFASETNLVLRDGYSQYVTDVDPIFLHLCNEVSNRPAGLTLQRAFTSAPASLSECLQSAGIKNFSFEAVARFSRQFTQTYQEVIAQLCNRVPFLCNRLRGIAANIAPFNPIRDVEEIRRRRN
ncbi:MAG: hypothetical protein KDI73_00045 [Candidatus Competibacteraceae bacterium]|nr:hypothetical protein [Candidatus Competibacteraceae bacterium]